MKSNRKNAKIQSSDAGVIIGLINGVYGMAMSIYSFVKEEALTTISTLATVSWATLGLFISCLKEVAES